MARRKNAPDQVRVKCKLAERLRELRLELFGERGGPEMARRLALPVRTWYNYEAGVTVPAEVVLRIVEMTSAEPTWLLHGKGPRYRNSSPSPLDTSSDSETSVTGLLRAALRRLEDREANKSPLRLREIAAGASGEDGDDSGIDHILVSVEDGANSALVPGSGPQYIAAQREWLAAQRECRCLRMTDESMLPLISNGAYVAYSEAEESSEDLDGVLAVVWADEGPMVRWVQIQDRYVLLRAQNPETKPITILLEREEIEKKRYRLRRVLWISTPR